MSGHSSGAAHIRQQRRVIIGRILLITRRPLRGCNEVAIVGDWEQHVSQLPQKMCCPLEMESLVPLVRCESKHESRAV